MEEKDKSVSFGLKYNGNLIFLFLAFVLFFPIAILIMLKNGQYISSEKKTYHFAYSGSWSWLIFFTIFIFPLAIFLLATKGKFIKENL